ncbi:MAG: preprotein translocase subunit YajC [Nitrospirota bacterium]
MYNKVTEGLFNTFGLSNAFAEGENITGQGGNMLTSLIPFVIIFVLFYFLLILPQQKKQKSHKAMLEAMKKGDKVITTGGILGTVSNISKDIITLNVADNVRIKILRSNIAQLKNKDEE